MQKAAEHNPDFVLVDIALGAESGFELTRRLVAMFPELRSRIVLISTRVKEDFDDLVQTSPAAGFLSKSMPVGGRDPRAPVRGAAVSSRAGYAAPRRAGAVRCHGSGAVHG